MSGDRPGRNEAAAAAYVFFNDDVSGDPVWGIVDAAYPVIVAAVRQHIAAEIDEARWADYENRYADHGDPDADAACTDHPTWVCHAAGASTAWSDAARIARGES